MSFYLNKEDDLLKKRIFGQSKKWMALLLVFVLMVAAVPMNAFAFEYASGERVAARVGRQFVGYDGSKVYGSSDNYALRYRSDGSTYFESTARQRLVDTFISIRNLIRMSNGCTAPSMAWTSGMDLVIHLKTEITQTIF